MSTFDLEYEAEHKNPISHLKCECGGQQDTLQRIDHACAGGWALIRKCRVCGVEDW